MDKVQHTPIRTQVNKEKDKRKKKKKKKEKRKRLRKDKAKAVTMTSKKSGQEGFGKNICNHVICSNPGRCERSVCEVLPNEMMTNVYVFGMRGYGICICDGTSALIITKDGKRWWCQQFSEGQENFYPDGFFDRICQCIVFWFGGRCGDRSLFARRPGDQRAKKIETISRNAFAIFFIRSPVSIWEATSERKWRFWRVMKGRRWKLETEMNCPS